MPGMTAEQISSLIDIFHGTNVVQMDRLLTRGFLEDLFDTRADLSRPYSVLHVLGLPIPGDPPPIVNGVRNDQIQSLIELSKRLGTTRDKIDKILASDILRGLLDPRVCLESRQNFRISLALELPIPDPELHISRLVMMGGYSAVPKHEIDLVFSKGDCKLCVSKSSAEFIFVEEFKSIFNEDPLNRGHWQKFFSDKGLRAATWYELLAFGYCYRDIATEPPVVALGFCHTYPRNFLSVSLKDGNRVLETADTICLAGPARLLAFPV
ncbi:MAG: hypothetical protein MRY49_03535 [Candidatus Pacebacteria bacterium]|nr:hypothetical protein [Candidatus Paceibacterota bacterium]